MLFLVTNYVIFPLLLESQNLGLGRLAFKHIYFVPEHVLLKFSLKKMQTGPLNKV